jgi:hypothetical protein
MAAAGLKGRSAWSRDDSGGRTRARRVTVKARIVKLNPQRGARTAVIAATIFVRSPSAWRSQMPRSESWDRSPGCYRC